ncbi:kinase-like protein [Auricularia subglabra TFB-10046 SS5]|nr:kinase-like protein [Auricularia subglabra TFB-10046 SS5]
MSTQISSEPRPPAQAQGAGLYIHPDTLSPSDDFPIDQFVKAKDKRPNRQGAFADVEFFEHKDKPTYTIAVKRMRYSSDELKNQQMDISLKKEISLLMLCKHKNLVHFLGLTRQGLDIGIAIEYAEKGTVDQYLRQSVDPDRVQIVRDVSAGLRYLHTPRQHPLDGRSVVVAHGDIHPGNVLLCEKNGVVTAMLVDFGLCKIAQENGETSKSWRPDGDAAGRAKYIAPEVHDLPDVQAELFDYVLRPEVSPDEQGIYQRRRTVKSDVFAFGMLIFEIYGGDARTLGPPRPANRTVVSLIEGRRPPRTAISRGDFPERYWGIITDCWKGAAKDRPAMSDVCVRLN